MIKPPRINRRWEGDGWVMTETQQWIEIPRGFDGIDDWTPGTIECVLTLDAKKFHQLIAKNWTDFAIDGADIDPHLKGKFVVNRAGGRTITLEANGRVSADASCLKFEDPNAPKIT